jgi:hypothetical protein
MKRYAREDELYVIVLRWSRSCAVRKSCRYMIRGDAETFLTLYGGCLQMKSSSSGICASCDAAPKV